jgi:IclR family transcriptional regulator, KDG regulon repressor
VKKSPEIGPDGTRPRTVVPRVEAVRRALQILGCFSLDQPELGVSDLARELGLHKSTIHRLIATLEAEGFIRQTHASRYSLSWKLFELGAAVPAWQSVRQLVLNVLTPLVDTTSETAHLAVLDGEEVLYLEKVESKNRLRMPSAVGRRVPSYCTALGKAMLADLQGAALEPILARAPFPALTPHTRTTAAALRGELARIRAQGYAIDDEELEDGLMCVAAPVRDASGRTCAAISIAGPASRIGRRLELHIDAVRAASEQLSHQLGPHARRLAEGFPTTGAQPATLSADLDAGE